MKILYLSSGRIWKSSGNSIQVLAEIQELVARGHQADLLLMPHRKLVDAERLALESLRQELAGWGSRLRTLDLLSDSRVWLQPLLMEVYARQLAPMAREYDLVQAHDMRTAGICARVRSMGAARRFIYDIHGAALAEAVFGGSLALDSPVYRQRQGWERRAVAASDGCFVVSRFFKEWVCREYGANPAHVWVTPSSTYLPELTEASWRQARREELGIGERPVLLYSGSMHRWQRAEDLLRLYPQLAAHIPGLFLLVLTQETDMATAHLRELGVDPADHHVRCLPSAEVQAWMSLGDVGALLRHDHLLNQVASPVKFADYLSAGVPVIISPGVGDSSRLVEESGLGHVWREELETPAQLAETVKGLLARRSDAQRAACRELCRQNFTWEETMKVFDEVYAALA
ncbi:MAG: glycosyltransferase family 4 protein [Candidatus Delongbacteria bacterium]